ncbi:MAG: ATP-binding cassette domain-containing protein, partial [Saezia sp.]
WKRPADLSGGMIKRVALARALIMDPPLLLLDEPTAGLDPQASEEFVQLLASMHQEMGLTVLMVSHDLDTIFELSTQIAVLAERRVLIMDTPDKVVEYDHLFINEFFNGERGKRAQGALTKRNF